MRKTFRNIKEIAVVSAQFDCQPPAVSGRFGPQVNDYVVNSPSRAANKLGFGHRGCLIMHAPQRSLDLVIREAALRQPWIQAVSLKFLLAEGSREKTPLVFQTLRLYDVSAF